MNLLIRVDSEIFRFFLFFTILNKDGCIPTIVPVTFLQSRKPGKREQMTVCSKVQTWWLSTAKKNNCVFPRVCVWIYLYESLHRKDIVQTKSISFIYIMLFTICFSPHKQEFHKPVQEEHVDWTDWLREKGDMEMGGWDSADHKVYTFLKSKLYHCLVQK